MTFKELLEELEYLSVDVDTEVVVRDSQGNYLEITCITDQDGICEILLD